MADIISLKAQRKTLRTAFTRMLNYCCKDNAELEQVRARVDTAERLFEQYEHIQNQIDNEILDENEKLLEDEYRANMEDAFFSIKAAHYRLQNCNIPTPQAPTANQNSELTAAVQALIQHQTSIGELVERFTNSIRTENASTPNEQLQQQQNEVQLPRIQLPEFDGSLLQWLRFKELFVAIIHNKSRLTKVEKLEYLQSRLKGEAATVIKHLSPTNDNYDVAWELLKRKYDNVEKVKAAYMQLLFEQPPMKSASLAEIKRLYNSAIEGFSALKAIDSSVEQWDTVLLFNIEKKLDSNTAMHWYKEKNYDEPATFDQFLKFCEKRIHQLESMQTMNQHNQPMKEQQRRAPARVYTITNRVCPVCKMQHYLYQCDDFKEMTIEERRNSVQKHGLCFNCLHADHKASDCKASSCKKCSKRHNTLLHITNNSEYASTSRGLATNVADTPSQTTNQENADIPKVTTIISNMSQQQICIILPTAVIQVLDGACSSQHCRALLDSGSQGTFITEACAQRLKLKRRYDKTIIYGLGSSTGKTTKGAVELQIKASTDSIITTSALILKSLTQTLPSIEISSTHLQCFQHLNMADPHWNKPGPIDIILGADVFIECCLSEKLQHSTGSPIAMSTVFGWVLMGKMPSIHQSSITSNHISIDVDKQLQQFWELEEVQTTTKIRTAEEEEAEKIFTETTSRDHNGRYIVRLPPKNGVINIGESRNSAVNRLKGMERKFKLQPEIQAEYQNFMREYIKLGHMQIIEESACKCFLPHHAVMKPKSTTTKLRVVFDASNKTSNGKSLNENLLIGYKVQRDLFDIIISFRLHTIAFTGDIEKMYRQVLVHHDDRPLQCILWRETEVEKIEAYCLNTVTYGTAPASFLATRTLLQITYDYAATHTEAAEAIAQNFYVDDFMYSSQRLQQAVKLKEEICSLLSATGFRIRKWASNSAEFLSTVPSEDRASTHSEIHCASMIPTLGLLWDTENDIFKYATTSFTNQHTLTKRVVLSNIARVYDPMGWISPIVVSMKIFMQKLWLAGIGWDDQLPKSMVIEWLGLCNDIKLMSEIKVKRWVHFANNNKVELHGFSDASELAYAAAVYTKVYTSDNKIVTSLIAAKTRVAPVKQVSLPRLELCAAHLLVKLMTKVRSTLNSDNIIVHGWTDSMIVIAWLSDHPRRWKSFVANRTSQIIEVMPARQWHHIKSQNNPADLATRGVHAAQLVDNHLWWHGPDEMLHEYQPVNTICETSGDICLEERKKLVANSGSIEKNTYIENYSNIMHLTRVTAFILRFLHNCKNKHNKTVGFLTTKELHHAQVLLIKMAQQDSFSAEIKSISLNHQLASRSKLTSLAPFIDESGQLRVGGRIHNANINFDQKHPIILHNQHHLTKLIVQYYHKQHCHAGKRLLFYLIHLKYWIPSASLIIKKCIYKCTVCIRQRGNPYQQQMGNIPKPRLTPAPTFSSVGIDYAGPVQILSWRGRGNKLYKAWLAVFVCLVTKAVHIELVSELSTAAFIAALRRFIARRGKPNDIYSDNGTNFKGADQQLRELYNFLANKSVQDPVNQCLSNQQIQWHFTPPSGPHFGGIWEAAVKSIKYHLKRVLKDARPTFEEMQTILCQIESCLNSRPLCIKYEGDTDPLTPAHFIILRPMTSIPDEGYNNTKMNYLNRWQYVQILVQQFWKKWALEYFHQMQQRVKWQRKEANISENDVVIIKDDQLPPSKWLIGKVTELHHGTDGLVRVVTVKTPTGQLKRPIAKLCPLLQNC